MRLDSHDCKAAICKKFEYHDCVACNLYCSVFKPTVTYSETTVPRKSKENTTQNIGFLKGEIPLQSKEFSPAPLNDKVTHQVIRNFCNDTQSELLQEAGCAVCGRLVSVIQMSKLSAVKNLLHILDVKGVTRKER